MRFKGPFLNFEKCYQKLKNFLIHYNWVTITDRKKNQILIYLLLAFSDTIDKDASDSIGAAVMVIAVGNKQVLLSVSSGTPNILHNYIHVLNYYCFVF